MFGFAEKVMGKRRSAGRHDPDLYAEWVNSILWKLESDHGLLEEDFQPERLNDLLKDAFETGLTYSRDISVPMKTIIEDVIPPAALVTTIIRQVIDDPEELLCEMAVEKGFDLQAQPRHLTEILAFEPRITK